MTASLTRLAKGAYADQRGLDARALHVLRIRAYMTRLSSVCVSHTSAALLWDLPMRAMDLELVRLSPLEGRPGNPKAGDGYHVHCRPVPEHQVELLGGLPTTDVMRTVLDCATVVTLDWAVAIGDAALHRRLFTADDLAAAARGTHSVKGAQRVRALPDVCSALAESPGESLLRRRLVRMGLQPREQVELSTIPGRPRVDFLVDDCLVIEFDGRSKYGLNDDPERAHWEEKQRQDLLVEAGYEVIRITWADLWDEDALARRILRALRRAQRRRAAA
jgi:very-short-patch-repair endonuclease